MELLSDFKTSVEKAFDEIDENWRSYQGLVVCGTHQPKLEEMDLLIKKIGIARANNKPFLGICYGFQLAILGFVRDYLGISAIHEEIQTSFGTYPIRLVEKLPRLRVGLIRVNGRQESHWHNYAIKSIHDHFLNYDFDLIIDEKEKIIEYVRLKNHPYFVGVQYHPEYQSSKGKPHPLLKEFLEICKKNTIADGHPV